VGFTYIYQYERQLYELDLCPVRYYIHGAVNITPAFFQTMYIRGEWFQPTPIWEEYFLPHNTVLIVYGKD